MESTRKEIEKKLKEEFQPEFILVQDDTKRHAGHSGAQSGKGHYKVTLVSSHFSQNSLIEQHQKVNTALKSLFLDKIHALALSTYSPEQWKKMNT